MGMHRWTSFERRGQELCLVQKNKIDVPWRRLETIAWTWPWLLESSLDSSPFIHNILWLPYVISKLTRVSIVWLRKKKGRRGLVAMLEASEEKKCNCQLQCVREKNNWQLKQISTIGVMFRSLCGWMERVFMRGFWTLSAELGSHGLLLQQWDVGREGK